MLMTQRLSYSWGLPLSVRSLEPQLQWVWLEALYGRQVQSLSTVNVCGCLLTIQRHLCHTVDHRIDR